MRHPGRDPRALLTQRNVPYVLLNCASQER